MENNNIELYISKESICALPKETMDKLKQIWIPKKGSMAVVEDGFLGEGNEVLIRQYEEFNGFKVCRCVFEGGFGSYNKAELIPLFSIGELIQALNFIYTNTDRNINDNKDYLHNKVTKCLSGNKELSQVLFGLLLEKIDKLV